MVFTFLENAFNAGIFIHAPQAEFSENLFPQQQKWVGKSIICFIKIQSENMKMTWNMDIYFLYDLQFL